MSDAPKIAKNPKIDKVLVIGPNGNVGSALIPRLLELGYAVRVLQFRTPVEPREGLEVVEGSTLDADSVARAVDGIDALCHMIRNAPGETRCDSWFNTCLRGTVNLLEATREKGLQRFVNGSADNAFGHTTIRHLGPITENSPKRFADGHYGLFKIAEEEILHQYHVGHGVPTVVTRFPLIWTQPLPPPNACCQLDDERKVVRMRLDVDDRPQVRHDVHVDDAIQGVLLALEKDQAVGEDFTFVAPAPLCAEPMAKAIGEATGYPIEPFQGGWHSWRVDDSKARSMLGYSPRVDLMSYFREAILRGPAGRT